MAWARPASAQVAPPAPETLAVGDWELAPVVELRARPEYRRDLDEERLGRSSSARGSGSTCFAGPLEARVVLQDARSLDLGGTADLRSGRSGVGRRDRRVRGVGRGAHRLDRVRASCASAGSRSRGARGACSAKPTGRPRGGRSMRCAGASSRATARSSCSRPRSTRSARAASRSTRYGELFGARARVVARSALRRRGLRARADRAGQPAREPRPDP